MNNTKVSIILGGAAPLKIEFASELFYNKFREFLNDNKEVWKYYGLRKSLTEYYIEVYLKNPVAGHIKNI